MGNAHPSLFPYEPLPTADGELIVTAGNDGQFRRLCEVLGVPELADDPRFGRNEDRTANRDELRPLLVERLRTAAPRRTGSRAHRRRRPVRADQHHRPGGRVRRRARPRAGRDRRGRRGAVPSVRNPITLLGDAAAYHLPPPALDEHGDELRPLAGAARPREDARPHDDERRTLVPDLARHLDRRRDHGCSARTWPPT